jgi:hypothetical protein
MTAKLCFVIMGFGKKPDLSGAPRTLDLDATYQAIIKPAVEACALTCIRADEVSHAGVIDKVMYEMLLRADLVIADISTANPNALYELGVRHALRPSSTIVIKETDGNFHFDLNHLATLQYKHLGEDIGEREARSKRAALEQLIKAVLAKPDPDSPVYTFLQGLQGPTMSESEFRASVVELKQQSDSLAGTLEEGRRAAAQNRLEDARNWFTRAHAIQQLRPSVGGEALSPVPPDPFIVQQLALYTYKAKSKAPPGERVMALALAWGLIEQLSPTNSADPETLGIAGAIRKRWYQETKQREHLEASLALYRRGFELKGDYYNGENYATSLDMRAALQDVNEEALYDRKTAQKVRERIVANLELALAEPSAPERSDYKWMLATMANTLRALGKNGDNYETAFRTQRPVPWEIETFEQGRAYALSVVASH